MKNINLILSFLLVILFMSCDNKPKSENDSNEMKPESLMLTKDISVPIAEKQDHIMEIHGDKRNDKYYWMRLTDEQKMAENPDEKTQKVLDYLNAENEYKENMLSHLSYYREKLFDEMVGRIKKDDNSVPYIRNGYYYIRKYQNEKEYPIYSRKKGSLDSSEELLFDVNKMAEGYTYYNLGGYKVSPNNKIIAFATDTLSRRIYNIQFKDLETDKIIGSTLSGTSGNFVWANDNQTIFYVLKDPETLLPYKVMKHIIGTNQADDKVIYEEKDNTFYTSVYKSTSQKFIVINLSQTISNEFYTIPADEPYSKPELFLARSPNHEFSIDHFENQFYIRTNKDAKNFKLMVTPENKTAIENWKELIPHRPDILFKGFDLFDDFLVTTERIKGISNIRVMNHSGKNDHYINFGEDAYTAYTTNNYDPKLKTLRVGFTSLTTPSTTYDYDMNTRKLEIKKQTEVVGGYNSEEYTSERIYAKARDGVEVPISLVYKKGTKLNGNSPLLLYGYGSYGYSMDPYFSSVRLSLLNRGFIYAIAHIRGGMELGKSWYEDGKMLKKKNTFFDFIDCGKYLVENKYTNSNNMYAQGGSAGGLLMGAVINYEPELFKGIVAGVPFVDVVTTMLDESIPLTTGEFDEWGNPKDKEYYDYIKSYSPYDNIEKKDYPAMLITTGLHDSQVQYWEPAKWIAKLRDYKTDNNPLMMHTEMEAGHGGASGRFNRLKEVALEYSFILDLAGESDIDLKE